MSKNGNQTERDRFYAEAVVKAPDFTPLDKDGKRVSLSDFKGRRAVLYFYPQDDTQ